MRTNFYYGGSINADFVKFTEWEKQERKKEKNRSLAEKNKYKSELDGQLQQRNLENIRRQKAKRQEFFELQKQTKEEQNKLENEQRGKIEKKKQLKEIYDQTAELVLQRKLQDRQKMKQIEKEASAHKELIVGMADPGKLDNKGTKRLSEVYTEGRLGIKSSELNAKKAGFIENNPKKFYDMGKEIDKKEFFRSVTEKQLSMEKNYLKNVKVKQIEKEKILDKWIDKGRHEEIKKIDDKSEKVKTEKESLKTEIKSGLESQLKLRNQIKVVQQLEDRAFNKLRNSLIQKDIEKETEKIEKFQSEKEKYKNELKTQLKYTTRVEQYKQKANEDGKFLGGPLIDPSEGSKNISRALSQRSELQPGFSPRNNYDSVIFKSPKEKFTGSLIVQTPQEYKGKIDFGSGTPSINRALGARNIIKSRPFEKVLSY